jgi:hypothetical protein
MKKLILALVALTIMATSAMADVYVNGYMKQNGTYVAPYVRSNPDGNPYNNYNGGLR